MGTYYSLFAFWMGGCGVDVTPLPTSDTTLLNYARGFAMGYGMGFCRGMF